jgi:UDP-glucose 4-epimerase/long-chain acyl-CoA synthetase
LSGRRTFGLFPRLGTVRLDTIPVDVVARAIVWASGRPELAGRVLHLCAGPERATRLTELRERVRGLFAARGLQVPPCISLPPRAFSGILHLASRFMAAETRRAAATLPVFLKYLASEQRFENAATRRWLEEAGIAMPGWGSYINAVLGVYLDVKTAPKIASDGVQQRRAGDRDDDETA